MTQYNAWLNGLTYNAVDDRLAMVSALWDDMAVLSTATDAVHSAGGVVQTIDNSGLKVVQHAAGANMSVDVNPGQAVISVYGDTRASYMGVLDATKNLVVSAADPTNPRIDSIYAQMTDQNYGEATSKFEVVLVNGTAAGSPVAPSPSTAYSQKLADIAVPALATSIVTGNITDQRSHVGPKMTAGYYSATPGGVVQGSHWYDSTADKLNWYFNGHITPVATPEGNAWNTYTPVLTASTTNPTLGTGSSATGEWRYIDNGDWVIAQGRIAFGTSGVVAGSGTYRISLPKTAGTFSNGAETLWITGKMILKDSSASAVSVGSLNISNTVASPGGEITNVTGGGANQITNAFPWTWAASDEIYWHVIYPVNDVTA